MRSAVSGVFGRKRGVGRSVLVLLGAVLVGLLPVAARGEGSEVTDAAVEQAITKAIAYLKDQRVGQHWDKNLGSQGWEFAGDTALTVLALLYANEDPRNEYMESALGWLTGQTLRGTYVYATRAHALALVPGDKYSSTLKSDLQWLLKNVGTAEKDIAGAYTYTGEGASWDNSNSQFGVLGVWMATDAGLTAPVTYWEAVATHWTRFQNKDGGWGYHGGDNSSASMTAAGLATLFVVLDRMYGEKPKEAGNLVSAIDHGLDWLSREYRPEENRGGDRMWLMYYLYGVERVGRASGYKYFRDKDWFREGAAYLLKTQLPDGSWKDSGEYMSALRNTDFGLMFLCHGRAPLFCNKLQHGTDWNAKLRDAAGVTHYAQRTLERLLNWQIVKLNSSMDDLMEAPILYISGQAPPIFEEVDVQKVREYGLRGGTVLAVSGREDFTETMRELASKAFPDCRLRSLPSDHPLFNGEVQFEIKKPPLMYEVNNGVRTLMLICGEDIAETWNRGKGPREHLQLGCNIYNYVTDKTAIRSRLQTTNIPLLPGEPRRKMDVAILKYNGAWNVEPYGWTRLKNYLNNQAGTRLLVTAGLTLDAEELARFKIAYITGTGAFELTPAEKKGLQRWLRDGGTLLADAAGSSDEFRKSLEACLNEALKTESLRLPAESFIFSGAGIPDAGSLVGLGYTRSARGRSTDKVPQLRAYEVGKRLAVIYSPLDVSTGLLGTPVYARRGCEGDGPLRILRNLLLYADLPLREKVKLGH